MSKSRQHWQEDSSDYTFSQYLFYLIIFGLVLGGLFWLFIVWVTPPDQPVTHIIHVTSLPGGELPVIPFQNEDHEALKKLAKDAERYEFDDIADFGDEIQKIRNLSDESFLEVSTVIVWLSAVGGVVDGQPVILGSDPDKEYLLDELLNQLEQVKSKQVILILDCNHGYANLAARTDDRIKSDINEFAKLVEARLENLEGKVNVIQYGLAGEKPAYSIRRRRSLIGYALEKTLVEQKARLEEQNLKTWTAEQFLATLDKNCILHGGAIAPRLRWFGQDSDEVEFPHAAVEVPEPIESSDPPNFIPPHKTYERMVTENGRTWERVQELEEEYSEFVADDGQYILSPAAVDSRQWSQIQNQLAALYATALHDLEGYQTTVRDIQDNVGRFRRNNQQRLEKVAGRLDFVERHPQEGIQYTEEQQKRFVDDNSKRKVARAYHDIYETSARLQHYVGLYESLSWVMPDQNRAENYLSDLLALLTVMERVKTNLDPEPTLDQFNSIINLSERVKERELTLQQTLGQMCRDVIKNLQGFHREMVVDAVMRLPFLELETADDVGSRDLPSREELVQFLEINQEDKTNVRIASGDRFKASDERARLFEAYQRVAMDSEAPNEASRLHQLFAYQVPMAGFDFEQFSVADRRTIPFVEVSNQELLEQQGVVIERTPTPVDLGLVVRNTRVKVQCEIFQVQDEDGNPFFKFEGTRDDTKSFDQDVKPTLVALQDAPDIDPGCKLTVRILDAADPDKVYRQFSFPIRLPTENRIRLIVADADQTEKVFARDELVGPRVSTLPNRTFDCPMKLQNLWHNPRKGKITLYACDPPSSPSMPGRITSEVRSSTLNSLEINKQAVAESTFSLPGSGPPERIRWKLPEESSGDLVSVPSGFLCQIELEEEEEPWSYWLPVFPRERAVATVRKVSDSGDFSLSVERASFFPKDIPIKIEWSCTHDAISPGEEVLAAERESMTFTVAKNVSSLFARGEKPLLYIDIDGWPHKLVYKYDAGNFSRSNLVQHADVEVILGDPKEPIELVELETGPDFDKTYATNARVDTALIRVMPDVPSTRFNFDGADEIRLQRTGNLGLLKYPRQLETLVGVGKKSGNLMLETRVSGYELKLPIGGSRFEIVPMIKLDGENADRLYGENRWQIQFDRTPPVIEDFSIKTTIINPLTKVSVRVDASDSGVGIDWRSDVEIFVSEKDGSLRGNLGGKSVGKLVNGQMFEIIAPKEVGSYTLGVKVADRVGNVDQEILGNQVVMVVTKPKTVKKTPKKEPKKTVVKKPPKVYKHDLIVNVTVSNSELSNVKDLEVTIKPEHASAEEQSEGVFVFRDLQEGVAYTVKASSKLRYGIDKGRELNGTVRASFAKGQKSKLRQRKKIQMK